MLVLCCFESIGKAPNNRAHIEKRRFAPYPVWYILNRDILSIPYRYTDVKGGFFMRLKELRKARGITHLKLAMDLHMNQNTISRYETGEHEAGYTELIRIADYFDVSIDYLLERTDNPTVSK